MTILLLLISLVACFPPTKSIVVDHNVNDVDENAVKTKIFPGYANLDQTDSINKYQPLVSEINVHLDFEDDVFVNGFDATENIYNSNYKKAIFSTDNFRILFNLVRFGSYCDADIKTMFRICGTIQHEIRRNIETIEEPSMIFITRKYNNIKTYFSALYYTIKNHSIKNHPDPINWHNKKQLLDDYSQIVTNSYLFLNNNSLSDIDQIMSNLTRDYKMKYSGFGSMVIKNVENKNSLKFYQYNLPIEFDVELNKGTNIPKVSGTVNYFDSFVIPSHRPDIDLENFNISFSGLTKMPSQIDGDNIQKEYYQINNIKVEYLSKKTKISSEKIYNYGKLNFLGIDTIDEIAGVIKVVLRGSVTETSGESTNDIIFPYSLAILSFIGKKPVK